MTPIELIATLAAVTRLVRQGGEIAEMVKRAANGEEITVEQFDAKVLARKETSERLQEKLRAVINDGAAALPTRPE